jgi:hypothetical protein
MPVKWNSNLHACSRHVQVTGAMWIHLQVTLACLTYLCFQDTCRFRNPPRPSLRLHASISNVVLSTCVVDTGMPVRVYTCKEVACTRNLYAIVPASHVYSRLNSNPVILTYLNVLSNSVHYYNITVYTGYGCFCACSLIKVVGTMNQ